MGEAGVGKSALLRRFRLELGASFTVLAGGCEDLATPRALGPLRDMAPLLGSEIIDLLEENRREA
jgi:hypothetical protein